jgi:ATP-dependent Clp protease ATP-binding subunit ClpC
MNIDPLTLLILLGLGLFVAAAWWYQRNKETKHSQSLLHTDDLTQKARTGAFKDITGREEETDRVIHIVMRKAKNNPLLLGQPGVGKTAIAELLAHKIAHGDVPEGLKEKTVLSLDLTSLVSETKYRGEMEGKLKRLTQSLEAMQGKVILFIDEIHMLEQIGGAEGSLNISDVLKPALARGEMQVIGATTWSEYEEFIKPDQALDRRFQPVLVDEPTRVEALAILKHIRPSYEEFHKVKIADEALRVAVELSDKKIEHRYLPDKAIDLIDEASAKVSIEASRKHKVAMGAVHAAAKKANGEVGKKDIEEVIDQWVIHSKEEAKRDARKQTI